MTATPLIGPAVAFVDGVRTPFGRARPECRSAETRADDLVGTRA